MNRIIKLTIALLLIITASSCKKYLDIEPVGRVIPKTAEDFRGLLTTAYNNFPEHKSLLALRTDEIILDEWGTDYPSVKSIYTWNDATPDAVTFQFQYIQFYTVIFNANHVIAEVENEAGKTTETAQLKGEALLLRAYCHFELLNLYAKPYNKTTAASDRGIPMSLKIDLEQNYAPSTIEEVYTQILSDITEGQKLLNVATFEAGKNYRFTTRAAWALLARVHEFRSEWELALQATEQALALNDKLEDLNSSTRLPAHYQSVENIMSLEKAFNLRGVAMISDHLLGIYDRTNDLRFPLYFSRSGGDYVSLKGNDNALKISFRNGELYLVRAEAALHGNNKALALQSLLALKAKRLKPAYYQTEATRISALGNEALAQEILNERERELALEGHRWYDLRRYGQPAITHFTGGDEFTLQQNDPRYTLRFPKDALASNPNLQ